MIEENKTKEEVTDEVLTTASLAGIAARPNPRIAAASGFTPLGGSSAGTAAAPALEESAGPLFSPPRLVDTAMAGHLTEPVNQVRRRLNRPEVLEKMQENFLGQLLGQRAVAQKMIGHAEHHRLVLAHNLREPGWIELRRPRRR